jgi:hypothetical protein
VAAAAEGDAATALRHEERATHAQRMEARFLLWKATGDRAHLEEAHRLLQEAVAHAPKERREAMLRDVPLHREIAGNWSGPAARSS